MFTDIRFTRLVNIYQLCLRQPVKSEKLSVPRLSGAPSCAPVGAQAQAEGSKESKKNEEFSFSFEAEAQNNRNNN